MRAAVGSARQGQALHEYEDRVLPLLDDHRGELVARERVEPGVDGDPVEVQIIEFADDAALSSYMSDARRQRLDGDRQRAIERTQILRLTRHTTQY